MNGHRRFQRHQQSRYRRELPEVCTTCLGVGGSRQRYVPLSLGNLLNSNPDKPVEIFPHKSTCGRLELRLPSGNSGNLIPCDRHGSVTYSVTTIWSLWVHTTLLPPLLPLM